MDIAIVVAFAAGLVGWSATVLAIRRWGPGRVRRKVDCPLKRVAAKVLVDQREADFGSLRAADVLDCSLFADAHLTCGKECLARL